jgi:hypothetical protein
MWDSKGRGNTDTPTSFVPLIIGILMSPYHILKLIRIIGKLINSITWTHMVWTSEYWFGKVSWACVYHHGSEKVSFFIYYRHVGTPQILADQKAPPRFLDFATCLYYIYLNSSVNQMYVMYSGLNSFWQNS